MTDFISLSEPWLTNVESQHLLDAIETGWLTQSGNAVRVMEKTLLNCGSKSRSIDRVTTCSNGTTALHLALLALGVSAGDEVIVPNFSYVAVANSVIYCGATPVVVDVDLNDWCMDTESLRTALSLKTKAVIAVDNYGFKSDTKSIREIVGSEIGIVRDAAEAFPDRNGKIIFGDEDLVTTSFYANKILTAGEGGAVWGSRELIDRICILKNQAVEAPGKFTHVSVGYNYRLSNLHAAVFNGQWSRVEEIIKERVRVFEFYSQAFSSKKSVINHNGDASPWLFTMRLNSGLSVSKIQDELRIQGIETRPGFSPFSEQSFLTDIIRVSGSQQNSIQLQESLISLPTNPKMDSKHLERIVKEVSKLLIV
jgi:perosamine synthetase